MKQLVWLSVLAVALTTSCDQIGGGKALRAENDSLRVALSEREGELDQIMGTFNEIQEGFRLINEAEGRVDLQKTQNGEKLSASQKVKDDLKLITETMAQNREKLAQLQNQLKNSRYQSAELKKAIAALEKELADKGEQIKNLQAELAAKDIRIAELDDAVSGLTADVENLSAENELKTKTVAAQEKAMNTAWFVFGTKSELKKQKILKNGDVLQSDDFNKDYFTQIDIRTDKEIKLYSKSAKLLTTHPEGSYSLVKDTKGQYVLKITDPNKFWSVSKYLVIQVR